ncbi:hypothetical protein BHE74_00058697, partial [Ensete ventricosum]
WFTPQESSPRGRNLCYKARLTPSPHHTHHPPTHPLILLGGGFLSFPGGGHGAWAGVAQPTCTQLGWCDLELQEDTETLFLVSWFVSMDNKPRFTRLPPGFRFHPTDEELVVQYLKRKVFSCPLPASFIPDINLARFDPWDLPGRLREAKYPSRSRSNRVARSGYWKATGRDKRITSPSCGQVVGMKKVLVFHRGKPPTGSKTDWVMHEYRLAGPESTACLFPQRKNSTHVSCSCPSRI